MDMSFKGSFYVGIAETVNHISLCTGYGGIDLGLKRAISGLRTIAYSEIEAFACANLVAKMEAGLLDPAPIWTDLKTFPWADFYGLVDILSGGYPCQPFSSAGKRLGSEDHRHLWPFISAGIAICIPRICFFENVEGHISLGLSTVISDLEEMGYEVSWGIFSASEVGAPHQRKRVFILAQLSNSKYMSRSTEHEFKYQKRAEEHLRGNQLAYRNSTRPQRVWQCIAEKGRKRTDGHTGGGCYSWPSRPGEQQHTWEPPRVVPNTKSKQTGKRPELCTEEWGLWGTLPRNVEQSSEPNRPEQRQTQSNVGNTSNPNGRPRISAEETGDGPDNFWRRGSGKPGEGQTQSKVGGDADGITNRLDDAQLYSSCDNRADELRLLGNGVVPQVAEKAFISLLLGGNDV